jgi:cytochrome b involved in lipid metabolism
MKKVVIGLLFLVLAISSALYLKINKSKVESVVTRQIERELQPGNESIQTEVVSLSTSTRLYTVKEVAMHGLDPDSEECWTIIHGKVYDILDFATNSHPGGELIFEACGTDATKLFETRPMGSKTPHSEEARKILEKYYIGDLK